MEINLLILVYNILAQMVLLYQSGVSYYQLSQSNHLNGLQKLMEFGALVGCGYLFLDLSILLIWLYLYIVLGLGVLLFYPLLLIFSLSAIIKSTLIVTRVLLIRSAKKKILMEKKNDNK